MTRSLKRYTAFRNFKREKQDKETAEQLKPLYDEQIEILDVVLGICK